MKKKTAISGTSLIGLVLAVVLSSGIALAAHPFTDVPDGRFFSEAVDWAYNNGVTTGTSATTFHPDRPVTRGENITFTWRYDDMIVQPALDDRYTKLEADTAIAAAIPRIFHAVVHADGTTGTGTSTGVTVTHTADTGLYEVEFAPDDIRDCVVQATLVAEGIAPDPVAPDGQVSVAEDWDASVADPDSVEVATTDSAGTAADRPFHLSVFC